MGLRDRFHSCSPSSPPADLFTVLYFVGLLRRHRADDAVDRAPNTSRKRDKHCNRENGYHSKNDAVLGPRLPLLTHQEQMQTREHAHVKCIPLLFTRQAEASAQTDGRE